MININLNIPTEIPKFFRELYFSKETISFLDWVTKKIEEIGENIDEQIVDSLSKEIIKNYNLILDPTIRIRVNGNYYLIFNKIHQFVDGELFPIEMNYEGITFTAEIDLFDGYYYSLDNIKTSYYPKPEIVEEIKKTISPEFFRLYDKSEILDKYSEMLSKLNLKSEEELYKNWISFNLNLLK